MNEHTCEMTIDGQNYEIRALTLSEYLEISQIAISKTLLKAPFKITIRNIEELPQTVIFSLMTSLLLLTSNMFNREVRELLKVR